MLLIYGKSQFGEGPLSVLVQDQSGLLGKMQPSGYMFQRGSGGEGRGGKEKGGVFKPIKYSKLGLVWSTLLQELSVLTVSLKSRSKLLLL